jgi:hypothetical protein
LVVALLMLFLVVGSATGVFAAVAEATSCEQGCGGEDGEDCCPPVCPQCACAARGIAVTTAQTMLLPGPEWSTFAAVSSDATTPESADADEILHVPIVAS